MSVAERLTALGLTLPPVAPPAGSYVPALRSGDHVHTSGQLPLVDGALTHTGVVGTGQGQVSPEDAAGLARICTLNGLAAIASVVDLEQVVQVVKVVGFVASDPAFGGQPGVVNGASDLLADIFGQAGRHTRSAVGVAALPLAAPVEIEFLVRVGD